MTRRAVLNGFAVAGVLVLAGGALDFAQAAAPDPQEAAVRRLMTLSAQNALAKLSQPDGFWTSPVARVPLPRLFAPAGAHPGPLAAQAFRDELQHTLNTIAVEGAKRALPAALRSARRADIDAPASVLGGDATAATTLLRQETGPRLVNAMIPAIRDALKRANDPQVLRATKALKGVDLGDVAHALANEADNAIWYQIGAEEAALRRDASGDPALAGALKGG